MSMAFYLTTENEPVRIEGAYTVPDGEGSIEAVIGMIPDGYASIASMLGKDPFYIAHRGGTENWNEMSFRAYTNAVVWGAGALEVSLARTSDDVYFGLHDEYLDRTSLLTDTTTLNPKNMTWEQVQMYKIFGWEPYMRLEELAAAYGETHVFFLDPKFITRNTPESRNHFLNKVKELFPNWQQNVVIKLFWGFNSDWGAAAKAAGFTTWAYLWDDDGLSTILGSSSTHSNFDWFGLNYDASESDWTALIAKGKPVLGHVCDSLQAAGQAMDKGAVGIMAANVKEIIPADYKYPYPWEPQP